MKHHPWQRAFLLPLLFFIVLLAAASAQATPGKLDPSFGTGGKVTTALRSDGNWALVRQPDGKLVAAGTSLIGSQDVFALARFNPNGTLDQSFGTGGVVKSAFGSNNARANALALQPDGKLVVAGYTKSGSQLVFALARYLPNGKLDKTFATNGKITSAIGPAGVDQAYAVALEPNGDIVAGGLSDASASESDFALAGYNPNGTANQSFGFNGVVTTPMNFPTSSSGIDALAVQPDGKIVAAGFEDGGSEFAITRYYQDGSVDGTFGKVLTAANGSANAVALQPNGKVVVAGTHYTGTQTEFALARYGSNGILDSSFGTGGIATTAFGSSDDEAFGLAIQPDGRPVAAGFSSGDIALARYTTHGSLDPAFGSGGKVTTAFGSNPVGASALVLQPDGKLVTAGSEGPQNVLALARFQGSRLTVSKTGTGKGTVTSSPAGINCGAKCTAPFAAVPVTLSAKPAPGSTFAGWTGSGCSGTGKCKVRMSADRSVRARFTG